MPPRRKEFLKRIVLIAIPVILVFLLLSVMCSEVGMMAMHAFSTRKAWERQVCGDNRQRLDRIGAYVDQGIWTFREPFANRDPRARIEIGASAGLLEELLESEDDEAAISSLGTLYWYEYCRDNNPVIDVYDRDFSSLVAVFRGETWGSGARREWHDDVYDCRDLERARRIVEQLVAGGFWEKVEAVDENWRGNPHLKVYELPRFHPDGDRGTLYSVKDRYYSAAQLFGVCTGHHHKLTIGDPNYGDMQTRSHPNTLKEDIEQIEGMPHW